MNRKRVFLSLALAPGLLIAAGAKIIGSKSPEPVSDVESPAASSVMLGTNTHTMKSTKKSKKKTHTKGRSDTMSSTTSTAKKA